MIDRLVKDRVVPTPALATELFTELKKYLVLCDIAADTTFGMHSAMVDHAWHAFILFTAEYAAYGRRYFGKYLDHAPTADDVQPRQNRPGRPSRTFVSATRNCSTNHCPMSGTTAAASANRGG